MARISNSSTVPGFLLNALASIQKSKHLERSAPLVEPSKASVRKASLNVLPASAVNQRKLIAHGAGVYEDPTTHDIWYREGNLLKRRQQDIDKIIKDYVNSIE